MKLDRFVLLNYTGFVKIVKKHDRVTGQSTRPWLLTRLSSPGSFVQQRFDQARRARHAGARRARTAAHAPCLPAHL